MKRRLFKLVLFLLLGAVVNVAVAWGCAAWLRIGSESYGFAVLFSTNPSDDWAWDTIVYKRVGAIRIRSSSISTGLFEYFRSMLGADVSRKELELAIKEITAPSGNSAEVKAHLPSWSRANDPPQTVLNPDYPIEDARGWPFLAMRCSINDFTIRLRMGDPKNIALQDPSLTAEVYEVQDDRVVVKSKGGKILGAIMLAEGDAVRNGILLPVNINMYTVYDIRALPLRPIWPGFAINTIFYAAILWLLTLGPFTARRMIRRKRGQCIKCGYDLRGTSEGGCPECGWRREVEA